MHSGTILSMQYVLGLIGIVFSFILLRKREVIGNMVGEADWMNKVGGIYNLVLIIAVLIFLWSIATLTGTTDLLFAPILWILPGQRQVEVEGI